MRRLPGENLNVLIEPTGREPVVLKVTDDSQIDVDLEEAVMSHLRGGGPPVPDSLPTRDGVDRVSCDLEGVASTGRLQRFLAGTPWREASTSASLLESIGRTVGTVHRCLADFSHPSASRTHQWDLATAWNHRGTPCPEADHRRMLEMGFHLAAAIAWPLLPGCPMGMLHGDANDENILVADGEVVGLLDFSDCLQGALVQDLAITLAYALQQDGITLETVAPLVGGYESVRSLEPDEQTVLFPLAVLRLVTSACVGLQRRAHDPGHGTWYSHEETTWRTLARLIDVPPEQARRLIFGESNPPGDARTIAAERTHRLAPSLSLSYREPLHITRGRGAYLHEADGRPFLDLVNNVCHVGHCHPRVVEAIASQAAELNTNSRYLHENITRYAGRLVATLPDPLEVCFFVNSGSEANELALRLARAATGSEDVLVIDGAYHGNTGNCIAMSPYKFNGPGGHGPPPWVHVVPMPDRYRGECRDAEAGAGYALEVGRVIGEACAKGRSIAGFFAETMLSCGGQVPLPDGYLAGAFEHVRRAGGVCVADEVQVGFGRVGDAFWGFELAGVVPDIVVMGKPIGNGHPLGAVVTTRAIADAFDTGMEFFSTFGGNPVSCACGLAVLDVIEEEGLQERARVLGGRFLEGLAGLKQAHELVGDVRGRGLFLGIELVRNRETLEPAADEATAVVNAMKDRGVLLSTDGPLHNVIKIKPPLVVDAAAIDMTVRLLDDVLQDVSASS